MSEWISVEDRLPDNREDVLVVAFIDDVRLITIGWYSDICKAWRLTTWAGEREPRYATHWMPLPEAPKEGQP